MGSPGLGTFVPGGNKDDVELTNGLSFGFRMTFNGDGLIGHEIFYLHTSTNMRFNIPPVEENGMGIHNYGYDMLLYANHEGTRFRPFLNGGVQATNFVPPGGSIFNGSTKFGFNYGGGLKVRVVGPWAARIDLRQFATPKPFNFPLKSGWLRQNEISLGIGFVF